MFALYCSSLLSRRTSTVNVRFTVLIYLLAKEILDVISLSRSGKDTTTSFPVLSFAEYASAISARTFTLERFGEISKMVHERDSDNSAKWPANLVNFVDDSSHTDKEVACKILDTYSNYWGRIDKEESCDPQPTPEEFRRYKIKNAILGVGVGLIIAGIISAILLGLRKAVVYVLLGKKRN